MSELVTLRKNDVFTNSLIIAEGTGNQHKSVTSIIRKYAKDFEDFGKIYFSDFKSLNSGRGRPLKVYMLNEEQATLLITYLDNTPQVRQFKKELVRSVLCNEEIHHGAPNGRMESNTKTRKDNSEK